MAPCVTLTFVAAMELNLDAARASREIEELIKSHLKRLPLAERKFVLERVAVDVLAEISTGGNGTSLLAIEAKQRDKAGKKQWEAIAAYCQGNPTKDGTFHNKAVAKAVFPERFKQNANATIAMVYTTTKRKSTGETRDPHFVILGNARFRLATEEDKR